MFKKVDSKRRLGIMLVVLAVLVGGITATGYADPLQITGPAVVGGTLTVAVVGNPTDGMISVSLSDGKCKGNDAPISVTLPGNLPTTLEDFRFRTEGPVSSECPLRDLIVKAVNPSTFVSLSGAIMAKVVLLFVVTP
jgi:heme A synthase